MRRRHNGTDGFGFGTVRNGRGGRAFTIGEHATGAPTDPLEVTLPLADNKATFSLWTVIFPNMASYTEDFSES